MNPALSWVASLSEEEFERLFNGSPVRRAGYDGLRRNIAITLGNSGLREEKDRLEEWSMSSNAGLRTAARRALGKLSAVPGKPLRDSQTVRDGSEERS